MAMRREGAIQKRASRSRRSSSGAIDGISVRCFAKSRTPSRPIVVSDIALAAARPSASSNQHEIGPQFQSE